MFIVTWTPCRMDGFTSGYLELFWMIEASHFWGGIYPNNMVVEPDLEALTSCAALNIFSRGTTRLSVHLFLSGFTRTSRETTYGSSSTIGIVNKFSRAKPWTIHLYYKQIQHQYIVLCDLWWKKSCLVFMIMGKICIGPQNQTMK